MISDARGREAIMRSRHRIRAIAEQRHVGVGHLSGGRWHDARQRQQPIGHAVIPEAVAAATPDHRTNDLTIYHRREEESLLILRWVALALAVGLAVFLITR
jgi:hypothetical protein